MYKFHTRNVYGDLLLCTCVCVKVYMSMYVCFRRFFLMFCSHSDYVFFFKLIVILTTFVLI